MVINHEPPTTMLFVATHSVPKQKEVALKAWFYDHF